jgi:thermosome
MDKMLVDSMGDVTITNDGATILQEMEVEHPVAKMLVEVAKTQDQECGDGTKTSVIVAGELLKRAGELVEKDIHPTLVAEGYRLAADFAVESLKDAGDEVGPQGLETLRKVAMTSMISKGVAYEREPLSRIVVDAVKSVAEKRDSGWRFDKDNVQIVKKQGGTTEDTKLVEGIIVDKEVVHSGMPKSVKGARIALADAALEIKKTEVSAEIRITEPEQIQAFLKEEERELKEIVQKVVDAGATSLFCEKGIDDLAQHYLAKAGIYAVRRVRKSDMEKLAKATGAKPVSKWSDLSKDDLGSAALVEERKIGDDRLTFVTGCNGARAVSILVRGGTEHVVDEVERSLNDALKTVGITVEDGYVVTGAGASAVELAMLLRDKASRIGGRAQLAIEAFADALDVIPRTLAENAGMDPIDTLVELRKEHKLGRATVGVDVLRGRVADMRGIAVEPIRVGRQALLSATDAAIMILRIDDVIASKRGGGGGKGPKPGPGGEDGEFD